MNKFNAEEFVDQMLTEEALSIPSDTVDPDRVELKLPPWFDAEKFNRGRKVYAENALAFGIHLIFGLIAVYAVPSILSVLAGTHRASTPYTAYRRYLNTYIHIISWLEHDLKPGSKSWKSFEKVRRGHIVSGRAERLKGNGIISQRDVSLTVFGLCAYLVLKPDAFGIRAQKRGDWEAVIHCFRVVGYMLGLQDRYNMCRDSYEETYQIFDLVNERVYKHVLINPPEPFEHMNRTLLDGIWSILPIFDVEAATYFTKYLSGVPGYILKEEERINLCKELTKHLEGKPEGNGVPVTLLLSDKCVEKLPAIKPKQLYLKDYEVLDQIPAYSYLRANEKFKLNMYFLLLQLYTYSFFKFILNLVFYTVLFLAKYLPIFAFLRFGLKNSYSDLFNDTPVAMVENKPNSYYKRDRKPETWYEAVKSFVW